MTRSLLRGSLLGLAALTLVSFTAAAWPRFLGPDRTGARWEAVAGCRFVTVTGVSGHIVRRIDRIKGKSDRCGDVHIGRRFGVVGVRPGWRLPAALFRAADGRIDDVARRAPRSRHFADRLLSENRRHAGAGPLHRLDMTGRRPARAIAEAEAGL